MKAGKVWKNPHDLVFTMETGENIPVATFYKHFKRIVAGTGRPDARPHDLRHTAARMQSYYDHLKEG